MIDVSVSGRIFRIQFSVVVQLHQVVDDQH